MVSKTGVGFGRRFFFLGLFFFARNLGALFIWLTRLPLRPWEDTSILAKLDPRLQTHQFNVALRRSNLPARLNSTGLDCKAQ
jgi:hypothetical protein